MGKDAVDTFKRYKTKRQVRDDALQFVRGLGHTALGFASMVVTPIVFIVNTFRYAISNIHYVYAHAQTAREYQDALSNFHENMVMNTRRLISWEIDGAARCVRGIAQILTSPLLLIKMPLRGIHTLLRGRPNIESNKGVKNLVRQAEEAINTEHVGKFIYVSEKLHAKYGKAIARQQPTNIDSNTEKSLFLRKGHLTYGRSYIANALQSEDQKQAAKNYVGLFKPNRPLSQQASGETNYNSGMPLRRRTPVN